MNEENIIYVFDFDETLARVTSKVTITDSNTNQVINELKPDYFIDFYQLQSNEKADFIDSEEYITLPFFNIFKEAVSKYKDDLLSHVWICTARVLPDVPKSILRKEGFDNIPIAAVNRPGHYNDRAFHARRKKAFVAKLIRKYKPDVVYFYDDIEVILSEVGTLAKRLGTKIILINSITKQLEVVRPD